MHYKINFWLISVFAFQSSLSGISVWLDRDKQSDPVMVMVPPHNQSVVFPAPNSPAANYVWIKGYWRPLGARWMWVKGYWRPNPQPPKVWVPGRWVRKGQSGLTWQEGQWL
jgi:hypothetical protein